MMYIPFNKTKIIATIGPASSDKKTLKTLVEKGVDVFRLNFSHGSYEEHQMVINNIREINREFGTHVCLLQDLQGPKIRIGEVEQNSLIRDGDELKISTQQVIGNSSIVSVNYQNLINEIKLGDRVLIDDGVIELKVNHINENEITATVIHGGQLKSNKGLNLPDTSVSVSSVTDKDREDLEFGIKNDVEWVALSFVRTADDVKDLRKMIDESGKFIKIVAKIEKPEAISNIEEIIDEADAIMVARGDLGVEIPAEEVPLCQKQIVEKCNAANKPVIIATQMMESMVESPRPTRAETNDIANSVMDGADALMLSAETAVGKYPIQVIESMVRTIVSVESQEKLYFRFYNPDKGSPLFLSDSLVLHAVRLAKDVKAKAVVGLTVSGYTAFKAASYRPNTNIFVFTPNRRLLSTISLVWGARAYHYTSEESTDATIADIESTLKRDGHLKKGDVFISMASMPITAKGRTNMLKINQVS